MKQKFSTLCLILLLAQLAACSMPASFAPSPAAATAESNASPTPPPYPLTTSNTWIYEYTAYTGEQKATWRITETVVDHIEKDGLLINVVERHATLESGNPEGITTPPIEEVFRYILKNGRIYRQSGALDLENLEQTAYLELVLPLENQPCWMVIPGSAPDATTGCRTVDATPVNYQTPAGEFFACHTLLTPYNNGLETQIYCPQAGFVSSKFDHRGSPYGYESKLIGYSLSGLP